MPKDEFDFADPFELNAMALMTHEDTTGEMAECFIEEFMRMRYNHKQILALFRDPHYVGPNMALEKQGEPFIRDLIAEVFARWGRPVTWPEAGGISPEPVLAPASSVAPVAETAFADPGAAFPAVPRATDPMGAPVPTFNP